MAKIDIDNIKKAFDEFEEENFVDSEETIRGEVHTALMDHIKTKLNLKKDLETKKETKEPENKEED